MTSAFGQELLGLEQILWLCAEHIEPASSQALSERLVTVPFSVSNSIELLRILENVIVTSLGLMAKVRVKLPLRISLLVMWFILFCFLLFLLLVLLVLLIVVGILTFLVTLSRFLLLVLLLFLLLNILRLFLLLKLLLLFILVAFILLLLVYVLLRLLICF